MLKKTFFITGLLAVTALALNLKAQEFAPGNQVETIKAPTGGSLKATVEKATAPETPAEPAPEAALAPSAEPVTAPAVEEISDLIETEEVEAETPETQEEAASLITDEGDQTIELTEVVNKISPAEGTMFAVKLPNVENKSWNFETDSTIVELKNKGVDGDFLVLEYQANKKGQDRIYFDQIDTATQNVASKILDITVE